MIPRGIQWYSTLPSIKIALIIWTLCIEPCKNKEQLTMGIVVPSDFFMKRTTNAKIFEKKNGIASIDDDDFRLALSRYRFDITRLELKAISKTAGYSPWDILDVICEKIMTNKWNTVLYANYNEEFNAASVQYLLSLLSFMGIPTIVWVPFKSGLAENPSESLNLQLTPSVYHIDAALLKLMNHYSWSRFSIITTNIPGNAELVATMRRMIKTEFEGREYVLLDSVKIWNAQNSAEVYEQLKVIKDSDARIIVLYASRAEAIEIMQAAQSETLNIATDEYLWIVTHQAVLFDEEQRLEFPVGMLGLTFGEDDTLWDRPTFFSAIEIGMDVWLEGIKQFILANPDPDRANSTNPPSLVPNFSCEPNQTAYWADGQILYKYMQGVNLSDKNIQFKPDGTLKEFAFKVMNLNKDHIWKSVGVFDADGLKLDDISWPGDAATPPRDRPEKYHLKVVTLEEPPYVTYSDLDPRTWKCNPGASLCRMKPLNITQQYSFENATRNSTLYRCCSGFCIDLLNLLAEKMGFDYELYVVEDRKWGAPDSKDENGKPMWNGLVKDLMDHKADMCMTSLKINPERSSVISFSVPFLETGITIVVAVREGAISPKAFLEPFDIKSWLLILLAAIQVVAVSVFLFEWGSPYGFNRQKRPVTREPYDYPAWCLILVFSVHTAGAAIFIFEWLSPGGLNQGEVPARDESHGRKSDSKHHQHRFSLFRSFWLIWAMLFGAAVNVDNPRGVSSRFMANIWALFAVVFLASYTANLAAFMIAKEEYYDLKGIQDPMLHNPFAVNPAFKFATVNSGATSINLKKNYPNMYSYMQQWNKVNAAEGTQAVKDKKIDAFIYDATVLEYRASHDEGCKLKTVGNWYAMTGYGVSFPKDSKYVDTVNEHLLQLIQRGDLERLQKYWLAGACKKNNQRGVSSHPLKIVNFTSAYILLAGGILLGALLLLMEHVYFKCFRPKLRKWDKCGCCGLISLSMGKSLTFEQSVMETLDLTKNYKCKNPICETQRWKVQHELDLALLKIERLHMRLRTHGFEIQEKAVWRDNRPKAITFREEPDVCNMPRKRKNFKQQASQDKPSYDVHKENKEFPLANDKTHIVPASRPSSTPEQEHKPKTSPSFWKSKKKDKDKSATPSPQPYRSKTPPPPYNAVDPKNKTRHLGGRQYSGVRSDPPIDHLEMETVL